jgi:hypothetical protein
LIVRAYYYFRSIYFYSWTRTLKGMDIKCPLKLAIKLKCSRKAQNVIAIKGEVFK